MITTHIFSIVSESPCVACGSPRVGIDQDDTYTVVPGTNPRRTTCACPDCSGTVRRTAPRDPFSRDCPTCGHELSVYHPEWWLETPMGPMTCRDRDGRWTYHPLRGCPTCGEQIQWPGLFHQWTKGDA